MDKLYAMLDTADPFKSWIPMVIAALVGVGITIQTYMNSKVNITRNNIPGQIAIVTGGNSGIGFEICRELCARGAFVVMACRDVDKGKAAIMKIKKNHRLAAIVVRKLDLASFRSVKDFAKTINDEFKNVDALINNAGVIFDSGGKTLDGFEPHFQVNYLSAIYLTELLRPVLQSKNGGSVVFTSAHAYASATVDPLNPLNVGPDAKELDIREVFAHSKALLVMWTHAMGKISVATKLHVFSYTPGYVRGTNHLNKSPALQGWLGRFTIYSFLCLLMKSPAQASQTAVLLVTDWALRDKSGKLFDECTPSTIASFAADDELTIKVYEETSRILKIPSLLR